MFSPIYLRLEDVPPPQIELGSEMSQVSEVNECILQSTPPPCPTPDVMHEKEPCEFQFQMDIWKSEFWFSYYNDITMTQHLQLSSLASCWQMSLIQMVLDSLDPLLVN